MPTLPTSRGEEEDHRKNQPTGEQKHHLHLLAFGSDTFIPTIQISSEIGEERICNIQIKRSSIKMKMESFLGPDKLQKSVLLQSTQTSERIITHPKVKEMDFHPSHGRRKTCPVKSSING